MMDYDTRSKLEDINFKYERLCSLVSCLQSLFSEGVAEVRGLPENTLEYSLYEIEMEMYKNNKEFSEIINKTQIA